MGIQERRQRENIRRRIKRLEAKRSDFQKYWGGVLGTADHGDAPFQQGTLQKFDEQIGALKQQLAQQT